ncbi:MAG: chemotaxis protein CheC [bacterium]|nr:chemotaxis protein CheC [bacterium]
MQLTNLQLDALREIGNIGNGHITTCLYQLTEEKIIPVIPEVKIIPVNKLNELIEDEQELMVGISLRLLGETMGKLFLIFSYDNALSILNESLKDSESVIMTISEPDESYLERIGQVIASTYIYAISNFLGILLVSYTPNIIICKGKDFLDRLTQELGVKTSSLRQRAATQQVAQRVIPDFSYLDSILCYQSTFNKSPFLKFWGSFMVVFDGQTLRIILQAIDKLMKGGG